MGNEKNNKRVSAHDAAIANGKIYFSALNRNGLYSCDISGENVEFLGNFPNEGLYARHLHGASFYKDGKVYFAPMCGNCIAVYDIGRNEIEPIQITAPLGCTMSKYYGILSQGNMVYFIPSRAEYMISMNMDTMESGYHNEWILGLSKTVNSDIPQIKNGAFIRGESLYLPYVRENILIKISLKDFSAEYLRIGPDGAGFVDASYDVQEDAVWLLKMGKDALTRYDFAEDACEEYTYPGTENLPVYPFINMIDMEECIYMVSYQSEYSLVFKKDTKTFDRIGLENDPGDCTLEWGARHYTAKRLTKDTFIVMNTGDYSLFEVDRHGRISRRFFLEDRLLGIRMAYSGACKVIRENERTGLPDYLEYVCRL